MASWTRTPKTGLRDPCLEGLRRRTNRDGRRFVHSTARRHRLGHPLHSRQAQHRLVRDDPGLADFASLTTLAASRIDLTALRALELIGPDAGEYVPIADHRQDESGLHISLPAAPPFSALAYVTKLTFRGTIPALRH